MSMVEVEVEQEREQTARAKGLERPRRQPLRTPDSE